MLPGPIDIADKHNDRLVVVISATGGSKETLDALGRLDRAATVAALTNVPASPITQRAASTGLMARSRSWAGWRAAASSTRS